MSSLPLVQRLHGQVIRISPTSADFILSLCELIVGGKEGLSQEQPKTAPRPALSPESKQPKAHLRFDEGREPSAPKLAHDPKRPVVTAAHRKIAEVEDDNVGVESARSVEITAEDGAVLLHHRQAYAPGVPLYDRSTKGALPCPMCGSKTSKNSRAVKCPSAVTLPFAMPMCDRFFSYFLIST